MSTSQSRRRVMLGIWLEPDEKATLRTLAEADDRSMSYEARRAVREHLDKFRAEDQPDELELAAR